MKLSKAALPIGFIVSELLIVLTLMALPRGEGFHENHYDFFTSRIFPFVSFYFFLGPFLIALALTLSSGFRTAPVSILLCDLGGSGVDKPWG